MNILKISDSILPLTLGTTLLLPLLSCRGDSKADGRQQEDRPLNVLFFLVDDLRPDLGSYGNRQVVTPNIDRLAKAGVVFTRAYCQQAVSNPSRASLLTGLRPDENGVTDLETHFRDKVPNVVTLPQLFKNNGYLAAGTGKVFHALSNTVDPVSWSVPVPNYEGGNYLLPENQTGKGKQNATECADVHDTAYFDGKIALDAVRLLKEAKANDQPFFVAVGFKKPHAPFCAPKKYWDIYNDTVFTITDREKPAGSPDIAFHNWQEIRGYRDIPDSGPIPPEKEQLIWNGYYACISYIDAQVGIVMEALDSLGLLENTVIVLWGDHGYHLGEQQSWCKSTNFELDARVPLIIAAPGLNGNGETCDAIVETLDVYPTLADLCNLSPESRLSGVSLQPLLDTPDRKWGNVAYNQFIRPYSALRSKEPTHMGYSVRTDDWRCTYWWDLATGEVVEKELYDLRKNKIEKENLAGRSQYAKIEKKLAGMLTDYRNGEYRIISNN
ncbi:MAG: sulfatase [Bacteroidales bacterium]